MEDTIEEVLLRVPVKSLVRCKSLSRKWENFISHNSSFRQTYISRIQGQVDSAPLMLGFFSSKNRVSPDVIDHVRFHPTSTLPLPVPVPVPDETLSFMPHQSLHIVGSSNGFLLSTVEQFYPMNYLICNPINKQWHSLPTPNTTSKLVTHGFICHTSTPCLDRYSVVRGISYQPGVFDTNLTIEIFSSDSPAPTWKLFSFALPFSFYLDTTHVSSVIVDKQGVIYLMSVVRKETLSVPALIIYDQAKQEQQRLQLTEFPTPEKSDYTPVCCGQSNGLILHAQHERHLGQLKIWMLTNQEDLLGTSSVWLLVHKVSLEVTAESFPQLVQNPQDAFFFVIKAFHPTDPQLLFLCIGEKLVVCNVSNSQLELVCDFSHHSWLSTYFFFPYTYGLIGRHLFLET